MSTFIGLTISGEGCHDKFEGGGIAPDLAQNEDKFLGGGGLTL